MADINFPISEAVAPSTATQNTLVYTTGNNSSGKVLLDDCSITSDGFGKITSKISFNEVVDKGYASSRVQLTGSATLTNYDPTLGHTVELKHQANTSINHTVLPPAGYCKFIKLFRIHDSTSNQYTLSFNDDTYVAGRTPLIFTYTPNAVDYLEYILMSDGSVYVRNAVNNMSKSSTTRASKNKLNILTGGGGKKIDTRTVTKDAPTPKISGVESGMMITTALDGSLYAVATKTDGAYGITTKAFLEDCTVYDPTYTIEKRIAGTAMNFYSSSVVVSELTHNLNIDAFDLITHLPDNFYKAVIIRRKDDTTIARNITFDPAKFSWEATPVLTQTSNAVDIILITCLGTTKIVTVLNDYGKV